MKDVILVTGGAGFIGSNFIRYMLKKYNKYLIVNLDKLTYAGNLENLSDIQNNPNYRFIKGDISDTSLIYSIFNDLIPRYVVNFAAESHVDRSIKKPSIFIKTNILGTQTLLNAAKNIWLKNDKWKDNVKFLQISTDEVYGSLGPKGLFTESSCLSPHSPYSASKASADLIVQSYYHTFGMPINITRCSNNYGPYQFPEKLIPLMINNALHHKKLPVYGDGKQIRDWLYVEDHCRAIDRVLHFGRIGEIYNIGGNNERENIYVVKEIIKILRKITGDKQINDSLIQFVKDRPGHDRRYGIDATKIKKELNWQPKINFETGLKLTINWYLSHKEWINKVTSKGEVDYNI